MKLKKEYIILAFLIAGLGAYLFFRQTHRTHYRLPDLGPIAAEALTRIDLGVSGKTIELKKREGAWVVGSQDYASDADGIAEMIRVIDTLTVTAMVSESKNYVRYHLDDEKKISVVGWAENTRVREFDIGKSAPTYQHTFVKLAGDPRVYHARGAFRNTFDKTVDDLRDRRVLSFKADEIREIEISSPDAAVAVSRKETALKTEASGESSGKKTVWETADGRAVDEKNLTRLLSTLSDLECERYLEPASKEDLKAPLYRFVLKGAGEYRLLIHGSQGTDEGSYPALSSQNPYVFALSKARVDFFKETLEQMLKLAEK